MITLADAVDFVPLTKSSIPLPTNLSANYEEKGIFSSCKRASMRNLYDERLNALSLKLRTRWANNRAQQGCRTQVKWNSLSHVWLFVTPWIFSPWNSPGQNTGVGGCSLLQGIFPTQGSNPGLRHCRRILYQLSHQGSLQDTIYIQKSTEFLFTHTKS